MKKSKRLLSLFLALMMLLTAFPVVSLTASAGDYSLSCQYYGAFSNHTYDSSDNNRWNSTRIQVVSDANSSRHDYSYGVWQYQLPTIPDTEKFSSAVISSNITFSQTNKSLPLTVDFYLVPNDKTSSTYAYINGNGHFTRGDLGDVTTSNNPTDKVISNLGLTEANKIAEINHTGSTAATLNAQFAQKLQAAIDSAGGSLASITIVALLRSPNTDSNLWSDFNIPHPTLSLVSSPKTSDVTVDTNDLVNNKWGVINNQSKTLRYEENSKNLVNIVSENKTNPKSDAFSVGFWKYSIPDVLKKSSIDGASMTVSIKQDFNNGYSDSSLSNLFIDFYAVNATAYGNNQYFNFTARQGVDSDFTNQTDKAAYVKTRFGLTTPIGSLAHGQFTNTFSIRDAVAQAVSRGDSELIIIGIQRTPNDQNKSWSDSWLQIPQITVSSISKVYSTTIDRVNDEDAVTGRVTVNNDIFTSDASQTAKYGYTISTSDSYKTTYTVNSGTVTDVKCIDDGDSSAITFSSGTGTGTLSGTLSSPKFKVHPQETENYKQVYATLMFTFSDGAIEYHRVAVKSVPIPAHLVINSSKDSRSYEQSFTAVARGSIGTGQAGTWKYLDNWLPGTQNHGYSYDNWLNTSDYKNAGNWGDKNERGGTADSTKVTATYYFDKSNHNLGSGQYFTSASSDTYKLPIPLYVTRRGGNLVYDATTLEVNTKPSVGTTTKEGLNKVYNNGEITGTVYIQNNTSIAASQMTTDSNNDTTSNLRFAASALNSWGQNWCLYRFDIVVNYFDKSELRNYYNTLINMNLKENDFTATSYAAYLNALLDVEAYLSNYEITTNTDSTLLSNLESAYGNLKRRADLTKLDAAYYAADLTVVSLNGRDAIYTQDSLSTLVTDAQNTLTRNYVTSTYDARRDYAKEDHQSTVDSLTTTLNDDVANLNELDTSAFRATISGEVKVDKDIYTEANYSQALELYNNASKSNTYTDIQGNTYTVNGLVDVDQTALDNRIDSILGALNSGRVSYTLTVPAGVTVTGTGVTDEGNNVYRAVYGTSITLSTGDENTAWYMYYDSNDTERDEQYQTDGASYTLQLFGNTTIRTEKKTADTVRFTVVRTYDQGNTNQPIECLTYVTPGTDVTLDYEKDIPYYIFKNYTDVNGNEVSGTYTVNEDTTIYANYVYDQSAGMYNVSITGLTGGTTVNETVAYNTRYDLVGGEGAYAWVELIKTDDADADETWRAFYIGADTSFFVSESITLKAVTEAEFNSMFNGTEVYDVNLRQDLSMIDKDTPTKRLFNGQFVAPKNADVKEYGILINKDASTLSDPDSNLILENIDKIDGVDLYRCKSTKPFGANQFAMRIKDTAISGTTIQYRGYIIYVDADGNTVTNYTDVITETNN